MAHFGIQSALLSSASRPGKDVEANLLQQQRDYSLGRLKVDAALELCNKGTPA